MEIKQLLVSTRSSDKATRTSAEAQLLTLAAEFPVDLFNQLLLIAGDASDIADSQSALISLKTAILRHWSPGFEQFEDPPLTHEVRASVRAGLLQLLSTLNQWKTRNLCAMIIARIGSLEYPDQWPDLVEYSVNLLESNEEILTLGGLSLLKELLAETFREEDFTEYGQRIFTRLLDISRNGQSLDACVVAVQCYHECMTFFLMGDDDQLTRLEKLAELAIPPFISAFCDLLSEHRSVELVSAVVFAVQETDSTFGTVLEPLLPQLFFVILNVLSTQFDQLDEELLSNFSFLLFTVLGTPSSRKACFSSHSVLETFTQLLAKLSTLNAETADLWNSDVSSFICAEIELDGSDISPRTNAAGLISMTGQSVMLITLLEMLYQSSIAGSSVTDKEAILFLIGNLLGSVTPAPQISQLNSAQIQMFLSTLEFNNANSDVEWLLQARKMITASLTAKYCGSQFPEVIRNRLITHAMLFPNLLEAPEVMCAAALRAYTHASALGPETLREFQPLALQLVAKLLKDAEEDTPTFLVECLGVVFKTDYTMVAREPKCVEILLELAAKDPSDIDLNAQVLDVVGELLDEVHSRPIVDSILRPVLAVIDKAYSDQFTYTGELYFSLELITAVLSHDEVEFTGDERARMLDSFYLVVTTTDDFQILQVASFAYAALVQHLGNASISASSAENVLKVAARLLAPDLDDSAALASGKLVSAIIDQFGDSLGSLLQELIQACAQRLKTAKNALLVETLVMVFCELTLRNAQAVVDILANSDMLEAVMKQWVPTFEVAIGAENIRKNIKAMELLFDLNDSRLNALQMPDEPIKKPGEILTRRKAKNLQFTQVSLPLKILKLLIKELSQTPTGAKREDTDDEWDDELVVTEDGEFFDQIAYNLIVDWFKQLAHREGMMEYFMMLNDGEKSVLQSCLN